MDETHDSTDCRLAQGHASPRCWRCTLDLDASADLFSLGFEAGAIWSMLDDTSYDEVVSSVHEGNLALLMRMGEATRRSVTAVPADPEDPDGEWLLATFGPVGSAP